MLAFGERTQFGANRRVSWSRPLCRPGTSPCDGWVVYAGEFRSYGQLLIINAGDGYHVLLAGLSQIDVQPGQFVLTAEPVGTMSGGQKNSSIRGASEADPFYMLNFVKMGGPSIPTPGGPRSAEGTRIMRKTDYAFWTFLLMTGLAGATTLLNVTQTYSATLVAELRAL